VTDGPTPVRAALSGLPSRGCLPPPGSTTGIAEEQLLDVGAVEIYPGPAALLGNLQASTVGKLGSKQQTMLRPHTAG
jgi:hypothetical protein